MVIIKLNTTARNGKVVTLEAIQDTDELVMITANGIIIRTGLEQIRSIGRNTQGVRLIRLKAGDKLVAAEKIVCEDINSKVKPDTKSKSQSKPKKVKSSKAKSRSTPKKHSK